MLVVGGGMAGMAAAAFSVGQGAGAGVVEKADDLGGSAAMSAGMLWTARDYGDLTARIPGGDPELGRVLVEDFGEALDAVCATGIETSDPIEGPYFGFGLGRQIDVVGLLDRWRGSIEANGGWVVRNTSARRLHVDGEGAVVGATVVGPDGRTDVRAPAVVLASGGYQGDPVLVASLIGPHADRMLVRSAAGNVGDGFRMAAAVGASASRSLGGFYGHVMPYPLPVLEERHYLPLTQYHSIHCIVVNLHGRRFVDESRGDEYTNQALLGQPERRGVLLADEEIRRRHVVTAPYPGGETVDRFEASVQAGANYATADTIDGLVAQVARWGVPSETLRKTLHDYARAASGEAIAVDAPMPARPARLEVAPFHALEVQPAITYPLGGLRVDADLRVLDHDGAPIRGLFAAGSDAGGVFDVGYAGGLAWALVSGRRAAASALREPRARAVVA